MWCWHAVWLFLILVYEGEDYTYKFQAQSEEDRDEWIQKIHTASYECLKMQLQSLREQIQAKTGRDPITQPPPTEFGMEFETQSGTFVWPWMQSQWIKHATWLLFIFLEMVSLEI